VSAGYAAADIREKGRMIDITLKKAAMSLYRLLLSFSVRYSIYLGAFFRYTAREEMLQLATEFAAASRLYGDYLEFGVFEGKTFITAFRFAQKRGLKSMKFYAFDSFQGLPQIEGIDSEFKQFSKGRFACALEQFQTNISKAGLDLNKVRAIAGWYEEVLNDQTKRDLPLTSAAIVYVDCDLYESTVPVLDFVAEYLTNGTVLIFDDWFCFRADPNRGEQRATREWLMRHPEIELVEYHKFGWHGNSFIVQKT
jgi:O-methyltransferase